MSDSLTSPPARVLFRLGPCGVTSRRLVTAALVLLGLAALLIFQRHLDLAELHARAQALPAPAVIAAIALLPLVGFPVSVLHLIAGVRFDFLGGIVVVSLTGVIHHFLGWVIVRLLSECCFARLAPWRAKLGGTGHRDATLLCCLLPGVPYSLPLYLLPVLGVPLSLLLGLAPLIHTARALVTILLGQLSDDLTLPRLLALGAYYLVLFVLAGWFLRHLSPNFRQKNHAEKTLVRTLRRCWWGHCAAPLDMVISKGA